LEKGVAGDRIYVRKINIESPYNNFCQVKDSSWIYIKDQKLIDDTNEQNILIPDKPISKDEIVNISVNQVAATFYSQKIQMLNGGNFPNKEDKDDAAYRISKIALTINNIHKDIFSLFSGAVGFQNYINSQDQEWQYSNTIIQPTVEGLNNYLKYISNFYQSAYSNQLLIKNAKSESKLYWLAYILSAEALGIMPVHDKIEILKQIAVGGIQEIDRIGEFVRLDPLYAAILPKLNKMNEERFALKVIESISFGLDQNDEFLEKLLFLYQEKAGAKTTLFETLYTGLDDNRLKVYSMGLINDADNRMKFMDLFQKIWLKSKYNPYFSSPTYTKPPIFGGVYTESFFLSPNGIKYFDPDKAPAILTYEYDVSDPNVLDSSFSVSYEYKMIGVMITVEKVTETIRFEQSVNPEGSSNYQTTRKKEFYGTYHLFQPVFVIGFKPDLDIKIPTTIFPIIYINYMVRYSTLKYIDHGILLTAEVALMFTGIGELESLHYLGYLKYISRIGRLNPEELVLSWKAIQGVSDALAFTAGNGEALTRFIESTTNDIATKEASKKANRFFGYVFFGSITSSIFLKTKVIESAIGFTTELDHLNANNIFYEINPDLKTLIYGLADNDALVISFTRNKIVGLPEGKNILGRFNQFENPFKLKFGNDFGQIASEDKFWKVINENNAKHVSNWERLSIKNLSEAKDVKFITQQRPVEGILKLAIDEHPQILKNIRLANKDIQNVIFDKFSDIDEPILDLIKANPERMSILSTLKADKIELLRQNDYFWLKCDFELRQILDGQKELLKGFGKIKKSKPNGISLLTDSSKKGKAIEFLNDGNRWSNGKFFEDVNKEILLKEMTLNEDIYISVDIAFYNADGVKISDIIQEVDGLRFNKTSGKIEEIISVKLDKGQHTPGVDNKKVTDYFFNCPDDGLVLKQYIVDKLKLKVKKYDAAVEAKIIYTDLKTGKEISVPPSIFKQRIKGNLDYSSEYFQKIHPETMNITKHDLIESIYQSLKNKIN